MPLYLRRYHVHYPDDHDRAEQDHYVVLSGSLPVGWVKQLKGPPSDGKWQWQSMAPAGMAGTGMVDSLDAGKHGIATAFRAWCAGLRSANSPPPRRDRRCGGQHRRSQRDPVGAVHGPADRPRSGAAAGGGGGGVPQPGPRAARGDRGGAGGGGGAGVRTALEEARAAALLGSEAPTAVRVAAIGVVAAQGGTDALAALTPLIGGGRAGDRRGGEEAVAEIERTQAMWGAGAERLVRAVARARCCSSPRWASPSPSG